REQGARIRLLARGTVGWSERFDPQRSWRERLRHPNTVLGPGLVSFVLQHVPNLVQYLPPAARVRFTRAYLGPLGAWWLRDRVEGQLTVHAGTTVLAASAHDDGGVGLTIAGPDGTKRELRTDHLVAGTGYKVDVDRLQFVDHDLAARIHRLDDAPTLSRH